MDIPFQIWNRVSINPSAKNIRLNHLIIRNIALDSTIESEVENGTRRKKHYTYPFQLNNLYYIRDIHYYSFYIYKDLFRNIYHTIGNLELYFTDKANNFNNNSSSKVTIDLKKISMLLALSATSFFDAKHIKLHLSSFYDLNQLPEIFSSFNFTLLSFEQIIKDVNLVILSEKRNIKMKNVIVNLFKITPNDITNQIFLKKFWDNHISKFSISSSIFLQILCNIFMEKGLFLSSPSTSTKTITLKNNTISVTLVSSNITPPVAISFKDSKKILYQILLYIQRKL